MVASLSERLNSANGKPSGFDYMRLALAVLVIGFHSVVTSYGADAQAKFNQTLTGQIFGLILPMFFCLSGFLVAGSLMRSRSITTFLGLRALRIYPALAIDAIFCGLILGPMLTTLPIKEYLNHPEFHSYLLNALGVIHYYLPGVFETNPSSKINGQLWTIRYELECYISLALLALFGLHRHKKIFSLILALALTAQTANVLIYDAKIWLGRELVYCFLVGVAVYLWREKITWNKTIFAASAVLGFTCHHRAELAYLAPLPIAYATVYLGLLNPKKIKLIESGDYSYGLFLYGIPIQQTLVNQLPFTRDWLINSALSIPITFVFAWLSWHLIEKRVLKLKTNLYNIEKTLPPNPFSNILEKLLISKPTS